MNELIPQLEATAKKQSREEVDVVTVNFKSMTIEQTLAHFNCNAETGLSDDQAREQFDKWGPNALPEIKKNKCLKFLSCVFFCVVGMALRIAD